MLRGPEVIMKYNWRKPGAGDRHADRRAAAPFVQPWPVGARAVARRAARIAAVLAARFYAASPTASSAARPASARGFRLDRAPADGFASADVLERLRRR